MPVQATKRIDAGITRGPRKPKVDRHPKAQTFLSAYAPETRLAVILDAHTALERGETTDQIGQRHNVPGRTVRAWLLGDETADIARSRMISYELARTISDIQEADEPLPLARAREEFRAWSWIAERRESRLYGQHIHQTIDIKADLGDRLRRARERVIEVEPQNAAPAAIEEKPIESVGDIESAPT